MSVDVGKLFVLQQIDTRISGARQEIAAMDFGKRYARKAKTLKAEFEQSEVKLRAQQTDQKDTELELQQLEDKLDKSRKRLYEGKLTNPKELRNLEQDIGAMERHRSVLDDRVLGAMADVETLIAQTAELRKQVGRHIRKYKSESAEQTARQAELETDLKGLVKAREEAAAAVDPSLLARYEAKLKTAENLAVAAIDDGMCIACRVAVPSVSLQKLEDPAQVVYCDNCGRILYLSEDGPDDESEGGAE